MNKVILILELSQLSASQLTSDWYFREKIHSLQTFTVQQLKKSWKKKVFELNEQADCATILLTKKKRKKRKH